MKRIKRWISLLLVLCMCLSLVPIRAEARTTITTPSGAKGSNYSATYASKLDNIFQGSVALFSNFSDKYALGQSMNTGREYSVARTISGFQCYIYANAVYYYLFGDIPFHGSGISGYWKDSKTVLTNQSSASYSSFANAGVGFGAYIRTTANSDGSYNGGSGHSMIVLAYDADTITILEGNADGKGLVRIAVETWSEFNSSKVSGKGWKICHVVQCNSAGSMFVDLGADFYAPILNKEHWKIIESNNDNVQTADENGKANQVWRFQRQSDGSYKISNCLDGRCLDVADASSEAGAKVWLVDSNDTDAQRWYIYEESGGYILRAKCTNCVLDLPYSDPTNGNQLQMFTRHGEGNQIWAIYRGDECQLKEPTLSVQVGTATTATKFTWTEVYGERRYDVRIWKDTLWEGDAYHNAWGATSGYEIVLPAGTYHAYVDAGHEFVGKMSNVVTFTVTGCNHTYKSAVTKPTCTERGYTTYTCTLCGDSYTVEGSEPLGHDYTSTRVDATCVDYGYTIYTCAKCGDTYTVYDGDYTEWSTTKPVGVDEDLIESKIQYRYADKETTTSYEPGLSGWTQVGGEWKQSGTGSVTYVKSWPSGFEHSHSLYGTYNNTPRSASETTTDKTTINSDNTTGYLYYHWCRGTYTGGPINRLAMSTKQGEFVAFHAFYSTTNPSTLTTDPDGSVIHGNASCCKDSYWYYYTPVSTQNYTTYRKLFTYERWGNWSDWSDTVYTASTSRKVETRTLYRTINGTLGEHKWGSGTVTKAPTTSAAGTLKVVCLNCSGTTTVTLPKLDTTNYTYQVTKAATCTAAGTGRYTWKTTTYGSFFFDVSIAATGHSYSYKATKAPTTSATGTLTGTCSKCSGTTTVTLPKLDTTNYTYQVTKAATCTAAGTGRYTWKTTTYGSFYFDVSIAVTGHTYTSKVTAPTCTEQGYTTYTCACGHSYKDNYTPATGHSYSYKATKAPTTSATGTLTGTCSKCSGTTTVTLPKLNTTDYTYQITKAATCTAAGTGRYTWKTTTYGSFYFDVTIAATNHSYSYDATKAPTTSATGTLTGTCSKCSGTTTVTLPKLNSSDYSIEVLREPTCTEEGAGRYTWKNTSYGNFYFDSAIAATGHNFLSLLIVGCEEQGYTEHICTVCQYSYRDQYTDPVGHDLMQTGYQEPTCTEPGNVTYFCKNCRKAFITELPPQHTYLTLSWPATCTTGGFTSHTCRNCGYNYKDHYTDPLGHSYEDGICIRCGEPEIVISVVASGSCGENIDWALYDDGTLQITGSGAMLDYENGQAPWYSLSETIVSVIIDDGITSVGSAAFMNCSNVTAVNLPYTLESIGEMAFYNCSFTEIDLPQSLTFLGEDAFLQCSALLSVSIPDGITVLSDAFANCSSLTNVTLPETLTALEAGAFAGCSSLQAINLPRSLQSIGSRAFMDCVGLKTIRIPEGITKIEQDVFSHCSALTDVALPSTLQTICEQAFRNCYAITSIQIPAGVTRIEKNAFNGCSNLVHVELPEGLTDLGNYAFYNCGSLEEITLPEGLSQLRQYTFGRCYNLKHVDIPNTLIQIDQHVFDDCQKLEHIQIAEDNPAFCNDADGVVYSADRTRLIRATNRLSGEYRITELTTQIDPYAFVGIENLTHITLPNSITSISPWCFSHCENLNGIEIPRSVTSIGQHAFEYCGALEEIVLPASLAEIGEYAFRDNASLSAIYFLGNAPILGTRAFYNVTATVYYPADNETWTEEYRQKYNGGKITWESYDISTEIASGTSGSLMWKLTDNGVLTFSGTGKMKNYSYKTEMPWYKYYDRITRIVLEEGVTSIGDYAFYAMPRLESIEIASTVVTIGDYAFKNAPKLNNVILPEKLSSLGDSSFYACTGLTSIEIPAKLYTIKPYTFKNCVNLTSVTFGEGNLQKISDGAFYGTGLTELILPDCLDILDVYAFKNCTSLTSIELGSGLTELREAVFYGTAIPSITIPEGITKIGPYAFKNCVKLQTIDLPESLTSVGEASFYACTGLKEIILPDAVKTIGNYAFRKCAAIEELSFGEELETIGECAFYGCTGLTELVIPDKVTTIKPYAFKTCTGLISVTLGNKVSTIGEGAFNTCTGLKTIVFPASLVSIGEYCFSGSMDLWKLTFQGDAPNIGTGAFKGLNAYACYPGSNTTWNSSNMLNYGGKLTWKPL